jgi:molybdate transport repressor ModE-like protein
MLDVTRLRVLAAVARLGSVTGAARELNYSQPSVSHHLARLEQETGAQLLHRLGRGKRLTEAGQILADRAVEILGHLDSARAELDTYVGLDAGRVRIAAYSTAIVALLPAVAAVLGRDHPRLRLEVVDTHPRSPTYLLTREGGDNMRALRDATWIGGCEASSTPRRTWSPSRPSSPQARGQPQSRASP